MKSTRRGLLKAGAGLIVAAPAIARAQAPWPSKPITIVVNFPAGGLTDGIARAFAQHVQQATGQQVLIDNKPGASGNIGSTVVARAKPDGYTIMSQVNTLVINPSLYRNMPYDPVTDFAPIGMTAWGTLVLVAHPDQKAATLAEFIAAAKAAPRSVTYGSPGVGTPHHLSMALIETEAGIELVHVPYKGSAGALQDNLSGQIPYTFQPVHVAATYTVDEVLGCRMKVVEDILLRAQHPVAMPLFAFFRTTAQTGDGVDTAGFYPRQDGC